MEASNLLAGRARAAARAYDSSWLMPRRVLLGYVASGSLRGARALGTLAIRLQCVSDGSALLQRLLEALVARSLKKRPPLEFRTQ